MLTSIEIALAQVFSFHIGQVVQCRNGGEQWKRGTVHSVSPLMVQRHEEWYAVVWDEVKEMRGSLHFQIKDAIGSLCPVTWVCSD